MQTKRMTALELLRKNQKPDDTHTNVKPSLINESDFYTKPQLLKLVKSITPAFLGERQFSLADDNKQALLYSIILLPQPGRNDRNHHPATPAKTQRGPPVDARFTRRNMGGNGIPARVRALPPGALLRGGKAPRPAQLPPAGPPDPGPGEGV